MAQTKEVILNLSPSLQESIFQLESNYSVDKDLILKIASLGKVFTLKKKEFINDYLEFPDNYIFHINYGLIREFYINDEGKEITFSFYPEAFFFTSNYVFKEKKIFLQALEKTEIFALNREIMNQLYDKYPQVSKTARLLAQKYLWENKKLISLLIGTKAKDRYELFVKEYPNLADRIPSKYLASFLGITKETLSRIKTNIY